MEGGFWPPSFHRCGRGLPRLTLRSWCSELHLHSGEGGRGYRWRCTMPRYPCCGLAGTSPPHARPPLTRRATPPAVHPPACLPACLHACMHAVLCREESIKVWNARDRFEKAGVKLVLVVHEVGAAPGVGLGQAAAAVAALGPWSKSGPRVGVRVCDVRWERAPSVERPGL